MSFGIGNFFKKFWKQKHQNPDKDLYNDLINLESKDALGDSNEKDEPATSSNPLDTNGADADQNLAQPELDGSGAQGHLSFSYVCADSDGTEKFKQLDTRGELRVKYTVDVELTHDYLAQNPWLQKAIMGDVDYDSITDLEITYSAHKNLCSKQKAQEAVRDATINLFYNNMHLSGCHGKETLLPIYDNKLDPETLNISFHEIEEETGFHHNIDIFNN